MDELKNTANLQEETTAAVKAAEEKAAEAVAETTKAAVEKAADAAEAVKAEVKEETVSMGEFNDEINKSLHKYAEGDIVTGSVIGISETEVTVDLGSYAEGIVKAGEMSNNPAFSIKNDVKTGDTITAMVLRENKEGNILLSVKKADDKLAWDKLKELKDQKTVSTVKVAAAVKGGCIAYLCGIRAFIPASQLSVSYVENLEEYKGKELSVRVITVDEENKKLVLSAKEVAREEKQQERRRTIENLPMGTVVSGKVEKIMPFGAFVNIGNGISGLVHVSQISEKRIKTPGEVLKEGDEVTVKLMSVKDGKLNLSIKACAENKEVKVEEIEEAPREYTSGGSATTGLADLLKNIKL